jgi:hypothetical protein
METTQQKGNPTVVGMKLVLENVLVGSVNDVTNSTVGQFSRNNLNDSYLILIPLL